MKEVPVISQCGRVGGMEEVKYSRAASAEYFRNTQTSIQKVEKSISIFPAIPLILHLLSFYLYLPQGKPF